MGLTQNPQVVLAATTGQKGVVAGAEVVYDTNKNAVTAYTAGVGYNAADFQASVHLVDSGEACHKLTLFPPVQTPGLPSAASALLISPKGSMNYGHCWRS